MNKVSQEDVLKLAAEAPEIIRRLTAERDEYRDKLAAKERHGEAEKLARDMHDKGVHTDMGVSELTEYLEGLMPQGKFAEVRRAVDLLGPDMGQKIAHLRQDDLTAGDGSNDLERYVLGQVG